MRPFPVVDGVDVEHRFVEAGGLRFHVAEAGDGPPLVLLHGWPQHWWMWREVLPALSVKFRCLMVDLRGLGWTDAPADGYEKRQLARDVVGVLDALGLDRVRLMGHDWGALTSQIICREAPERVERCVSISVPSPEDAGLDPRRALGIMHIPPLSAPFAEAYVPSLARLLLFGVPDGARDEFVAALDPPERRRATVGYYRTFLLRELPEMVRHAAGRLDVPVRYLGGTSDPITRWSRGVEKIEGGHFLPETRPDAIVDAAVEFL